MVTMKTQYPMIYANALEAAKRSRKINSSYTEGDWHNDFMCLLAGKSEDFLEVYEETLHRGTTTPPLPFWENF